MGGIARAEALTPAERSEIASLGGKTSSDRMTPEERKARAKKAAKARWKK